MDIRVKGGELSKEEIGAYVEHVRSKFKNRVLLFLEIEIDGDFVNLRWETRPQKFERLRRITGYLTSDVRFWNNAKAAEERDRVKHI